MRNKSIIKSVLAIVLVIASLFTLFGCKKDDCEKLQYIDGNLPNQITNQRFYFQQGYLDTWEVTQQGSDDYAINVDTLIVCSDYSIPIHNNDKIGRLFAKNFYRTCNENISIW